MGDGEMITWLKRNRSDVMWWAIACEFSWLVCGDWRVILTTSASYVATTFGVRWLMRRYFS